jgi:hypothetical protein
VIVERLICGFMAVVGEWGTDARLPIWESEARTLANSAPLRLWVEHSLRIRPSGVDDYGRALQFAFVEGDPSGVLVLAQVDDPAALQAVREGWLRGLSFHLASDELSLAHKPAYRNCRILGVGEAALEVWKRLTGATWQGEGQLNSPSKENGRDIDILKD